MAESPLLRSYPTIRTSKGEYEMQPLGLQALQVFLRVLKEIATKGNAEALNALRGQRVQGSDVVSIVLIAGLDAAFDDVIKFLAIVMGLPSSQLKDAGEFGIDALFDIIEGLIDHKDIEAFLSRALNLARADNPTLKRVTELFSSEPSTSSKPATDGQTSTS